MDVNLKREAILDNYQNPANRGLPTDSAYRQVNSKNESCVDNITVAAKVSHGKLEDIKFDGEACAICTSSTSIMIETLIGKTLKEVEDILVNYSNMIDEKEYNKDILENAIVYSDISKQPNRKKCALLPWWGIKKVIDELEK